MSLLSNQDEVNVQQYINATFDANANEHEILVNESPEKSNQENNNNKLLLDEKNTLINKDNNNENNNINDTDIKLVKSASSCGFNENIEEYGEGGNSLIKKMNKINKKEFNTIQVRNEPKDNINNNNNINIMGKIFLNKNNNKGYIIKKGEKINDNNNINNNINEGRPR